MLYECRKKNAKDDLRLYIPEVIGMLKREGKFPAMHVYACTLRSYEKFCAEERHPKNTTTSLSMQEIFTPERLKEYEDWLAGQQSSPNTISTYMRTLQAVYNRWMSPGIEGYNPVLFKDVYTKVESRTKRALTAEQMEQLRNTDFSVLTLRQQQVLTYFLLMFMLRGMPFIDLAHLRKSDLRNRRITYRRHKTGKLMVVDVPPDAMRLLQKYRDKTDSEYLFPLLHGGLFMEEHHHRYQETLRHFNRELARLMKQLLPGVSVSSYTARHTWATLAYHSGVPVGLISQSLGHSSIRVTMTYLKPFDAEVIDRINRQVISLVKKSKKKKDGRFNMLYGTSLR
ncbi:site-specific integrase [Bacteroides cellulosilyticus]|nr:site-specific integrase [Bacteroides cellulosilyticus]